MKKSNILVFLLLLYVSGLGQPSFTQFYSSPLFVNPANTGRFMGDCRAGGVYRTETNANQQLNTKASIFYDTRILASSLPENDRLSIGISGLSEKNLFAGIKNSYFRLSLAYRKSLDESGLQYLSIGFQGGFSHRKIEPPTYVFEDQLLAWSSAGFKGLGLFQQNPVNINYTDLNAGVGFQGLLGDQNLLSLGFSIFHINSPAVLFDGGSYSEAPLPGFQLGLETRLPPNSKLYSSFLITKSKKEIEDLFLSCMYLTKINEKNYHIGGGLVYRKNKITDAVIAPCLSLQYNSFLLHVSYDVPMTRSITSPSSGFELGMIFSGKRKKIN